MNSAEEVLDLYFLETRHKLLDVAAFLDRVERAGGTGDFRMQALKKALALLHEEGGSRAEAILQCFSDPTREPVDKAPGKGAAGAWPGGTGA